MKTTVIDLYCLNPRAWLKFICKSTSCMLLHFRADAALQYSQALNQFCFGSGTVILYSRCFTFLSSMNHEP